MALESKTSRTEATNGRSVTPDVAQETLEHFAVLALHGGNLRRTGRELDIPWETLRDQRNRYPDVYSGIARRIQQRLEKRAELKAGETAFNALEGTDELVTAVRQDLEDGNVKDKAGAALRLATIFGITTDKSQLFQGKPTQITADATPSELVRRIQSKTRVEAIPESPIPPSESDKGLG